MAISGLMLYYRMTVCPLESSFGDSERFCLHFIWASPYLTNPWGTMSMVVLWLGLSLPANVGKEYIWLYLG